MTGARRGRPRKHDRFVMRWPIADKDLPVRDLTAEGRADLFEALALIGFEALAPPQFRISHGLNPELVANVLVREKQTTKAMEGSK